MKALLREVVRGEGCEGGGGHDHLQLADREHVLVALHLQLRRAQLGTHELGLVRVRVRVRLRVGFRVRVRVS